MHKRSGRASKWLIFLYLLCFCRISWYKLHVLFHCQIASFDNEYYKPKWDGGTLTNLIDNYITHMYIYMYISKNYIYF